MYRVNAKALIAVVTDARERYVLGRNGISKMKATTEQALSLKLNVFNFAPVKKEGLKSNPPTLAAFNFAGIRSGARRNKCVKLTSQIRVNSKRQVKPARFKL